MSYHPEELLLQAYVEGTLDDVAAFTVAIHLESCPICKRKVTMLENQCGDKLANAQTDTSVDDFDAIFNEHWPPLHPKMAVTNCSMAMNCTAGLWSPYAENFGRKKISTTWSTCSSSQSMKFQSHRDHAWSIRTMLKSLFSSNMRGIASVEQGVENLSMLVRLR